MLKEERQQIILDALRRDGKVVATELSARLQVSEDTIRRDLRELAASGRLTRVHGGGLPHSPASASYAERQRQSPQAKVAIAHAAAALIQPGQVVILDGGTTNQQLARAIPHDLHATIITNSPPIATELAEHPALEIILIGGTFYKSSLVTIGAAVVAAFQQVRADLCMLGICSLHPEAGITLPDYEECFVKQAMMRNAAQVVALVSHEKLGTASPYTVAPITALTHLITEENIPTGDLQPYRQAGIQIIQV